MHSVAAIRWGRFICAKAFVQLERNHLPVANSWHTYLSHPLSLSLIMELSTCVIVSVVSVNWRWIALGSTSFLGLFWKLTYKIQVFTQSTHAWSAFTASRDLKCLHLPIRTQEMMAPKLCMLNSIVSFEYYLSSIDYAPSSSSELCRYSSPFWFTSIYSVTCSHYQSPPRQQPQTTIQTRLYLWMFWWIFLNWCWVC